MLHPLEHEIRQKRSLLCVGLDPDPAKLPEALQDKPDPLLAFNEAIIEATLPYTVAYKLNLAFYEAQGLRGWEALEGTLNRLKGKVFTIADAKRSDIGNTAEHYAYAYLDRLGFDAITVNPYMGTDALTPFLRYEGKTIFSLALTSNRGAKDFQTQGEPPLYEQVIRKAQAVEGAGELGFVVGATQAPYLTHIRSLAPNNWLLVPGIGAQGGRLDAVLQALITRHFRLLIVSGRAILYASDQPDFDEAAAQAAEAQVSEMQQLIDFAAY
jgi:orotidine-5'-phosphate decarboxylase